MTSASKYFDSSHSEELIDFDGNKHSLSSVNYLVCISQEVKINETLLDLENTICND